MENEALDAIAAEETAEQAEAQQKQKTAEAQQQASEQEELFDGWRQAVNAAKDLITSALPEAAPVWTQDRCDNFAAALARCDQHYGWGGAAVLLGNPLLGLAVAGLPLAIGTAQTYKAVKARAAAQAAIEKASRESGIEMPKSQADRYVDAGKQQQGFTR